MGTINSNTIISKAGKVLSDVTGVRWDSAELLGWLNSGQREISIFKPNSNVKASVVQLVKGTRQSLPADAMQLIDVVRNMGTDGLVPGRSIRQTDRETLDSALPTWHAAKPSAVVKNYIFNPLDPKNYYIYPPQPATGQGFVELVHGAIPVDVVANGVIAIDDIYETVLLDYMLYRAFSKDSEYADQSKSDKYFGAFSNAMGTKSKIEAGISPTVSAPANTVST